MKPPDRLYINMGEWLRDMKIEDDEHLTADIFRELGSSAGHFFLGAYSTTQNHLVAIKLTHEFIHFLAERTLDFGDDNEDEE